MINPDNTPDASPDTAWLRAAFDQAGEPEPDSALWPRILHSHQRRRRWRALRRGALVCVLALAALAVPALWPGGEAMAPDVALRDVPASAELGGPAARAPPARAARGRSPGSGRGPPPAGRGSRRSSRPR